MPGTSNRLILDTLDADLADWQRRLATIDANLTELESSSTCQMLDKGLKLSGVSQERTIPALAGMRELFAYRTLLNDTIDRARALRAGVSRLLPSERTLREIHDLLNGPSINLPASATPLARRSLLQSANSANAISPESLLNMMSAAFEQARDALSALDEAWDTLRPAMDAAEQEARRLQTRAAAADARQDVEVQTLLLRIGQVRQQVLDDPIGAQGRFAQDVRAPLDALAARLDGLERAHATAQAAAAQARVAAEAALATAVARQNSVERHAASLPAGEVAGLREWLDTLAQTCADGHYSAASIGLANWSAAADRLYAAEEERQRQKGLLAALRAKAQVLRSRGITIDPGLDSVALDAEQALRAQPMDQERVTRLLTALRQGLANTG